MSGFGLFIGIDCSQEIDTASISLPLDLQDDLTGSDPRQGRYKPVFTEDKTFILYCQSDWRGVLAAATLKEMGLPNVFHLAGGFTEWRKSGGPTGGRPKKP